MEVAWKLVNLTLDIFKTLRVKDQNRTPTNVASFAKGFQRKVDLMATLYVHLFGKKLTPYLHILFGGHVRDFLVRHPEGLFR